MQINSLLLVIVLICRTFRIIELWNANTESLYAWTYILSEFPSTYNHYYVRNVTDFYRISSNEYLKNSTSCSMRLPLLDSSYNIYVRSRCKRNKIYVTFFREAWLKTMINIDIFFWNNLLLVSDKIVSVVLNWYWNTIVY